MILFYLLMCTAFVHALPTPPVPDQKASTNIEDVHQFLELYNTATKELNEKLGMIVPKLTEEEASNYSIETRNDILASFSIISKTMLPEMADFSTSYFEEKAKTFINESSQPLFDFFDTLAQEQSKDASNVLSTFDDLDVPQSTAEELSKLISYARLFPISTFKDKELILGIKNIRMAAYLYVLGDEYYDKLAISTTFLKELATDADICKYDDSDDCSMAYMPDIHKIIRESNDEAEIRFYWNAWRDQNQEWGATHLGEFVNLFKKAATISDVKPLELWYRIYLDPDFLSGMEKVMQDLKPFYEKIHAYIRHNLNEKYGDEIVPPTGPIPHHLYYQVLVQNWNNNTDIKPPYPDYSFPDLDSAIQDMVNQTDKDLLKIADEFFESIGIADPDTTYTSDDESSTTDKSGTNDCKAEIYTQSPLYSIVSCPQINFRKFLQNHGWTMYTHYAAQKKDLPFAYFQSYNFEKPAGEAVILSASSPKHLQTLGIITEKDLADNQFIDNRLFKMSVHTMLKIPTFFVHSKVMNNLLSGEVEMENVNKYYWKLMNDYAGVAPPSERSEETFDFPHNFYEDLENNHQTAKFISEIAGYQIYQSLCEMNEATQDSLHNCDFYGLKEVGEKLKEFMKLGSTKPWREVLATVTKEESGLKADALLEYYSPISKWLDVQIKEKTLRKGWASANAIPCTVEH